jgi:hypothetical protein
MTTVVAEYRQPNSTPGGQVLSLDTWNTYPLNAFGINTNNIAVFDAVNVNDILLPPGTYQINGGRAMILHMLDGDVRVIRSDTGAILGIGEWFYSRSTNDQALYATLTLAQFTLNALTPIRMQYYVDEPQHAQDANDLGYPLNGILGAGLAYELYGHLWIQKIA